MLGKEYQPNESFVRVATACPEVAIGNVATNVMHITDLYLEAAKQDTNLVVFPEMAVTGYTIGDMVQQRILLQDARQGLLHLAAQTKGVNTAMVVGVPLVVRNALYNCAAVLSGGRIRGIVPKIHLANDNEFQEKRWFRSWDNPEVIEISIGDQMVPVGNKMLFRIGEAELGVETCEDLCVPQPPSGDLAEGGATLIANGAASTELMGKSKDRRRKVGEQAGRLAVGYIYAGCDASESTTDVVMSGHQMIVEHGTMLAERQPLSMGQQLTIADIDIDHLQNLRIKNTNFGNTFLPVVDCEITPEQTDLLRTIDPHPYIPKGAEREEELQTAINIQAQALATRIRDSGIYNMVLGLSGGLDSTAVLLAAIRAAERLGLRPADVIQTITMPGEASSDHTQGNARQLAVALGIPNETIPIPRLANEQLRAIGHDGSTQDVTYENAQARVRTNILFNRANQNRAMVLGTGDLSEAALGWCTFNGDHMSHYNVNATIPKTLVRELVAFAAKQPEFAAAKSILDSILHTPISPELTRSGSEGITQETEDIIGPYELHDFFWDRLVGWNDHPGKISYLAAHAFGKKYSPQCVDHWLSVFLARFNTAQLKRSAAPDGPKITPKGANSRCDLRMPTSMSPGIWGRYALVDALQ
jgi:NAD+ synthase (glutamine-hydrolysing)